MKIQPYRIVESEHEENYNTIYEFIIGGSEKKPYVTQIEVDDFNEEGVLANWSCTCKDFIARGKCYPEDCKLNDWVIVWDKRTL